MPQKRKPENAPAERGASAGRPRAKAPAKAAARAPARSKARTKSDPPTSTRWSAGPRSFSGSTSSSTLLASNAELFQLLVESVRDYAIFVLDPSGCVATWNVGAERIKGYTAREIIGKHFSRFYPKEDVLAGKCERELDGATRVGRFEDEGWRLRKDGTKFWANVVITALRNRDGTLVGFAKVTRDLTARRAADEERIALARAEESNRLKDAFLEREREAKQIAEEARIALSTTLRSIGDAVITTNAHGHVTMMNQVAEQLTEWSEDDARGVHLTEVFDIVNEQTRKVVESPAERVLREGVVVGLANHTVLLGRAGTETPIDDSGAPIRDENGAIRGVVLVFRSASEEKQQLLRAAYLADVTTALTSSLDYRANLVKLAQLAVPKLADWCRVDLVEEGTSVPKPIALAHVDPAKVETLRRWVEAQAPRPDAPRGIGEVVRTGVTQLYETVTDDLVRERVADEEERRFLGALQLSSLVIAPISTSVGVIGAITLAFAESGRRYAEKDAAFAEDVGRRAGLAIENAKLFEAAHDARRAADEANRSKDEFLARISHELRTPLNAILGWAQLMSNASFDSAKRGRGVSTIVRNAQAMAKLIEDLLDISRITSGKMHLEVEPVDLLPLIDAAIDAVKPAADAKHIAIGRKFDAGHHIVRGDGTRLQQIAWNLLTNAVKFTPDGGHVEVAVRLLESAIELSVTDDGKGITPAFLPHVFQPFRQADTGTARGGAGLGLGLSISKQLVERHGGHIGVRSDGAGRGTTFTVHLPRALDAAERVAPAPIAAAAATADLAGRLVLVVDDEADARALIETVLEQCGARVTTASCVADALVALEQETPDVLVSDIGMPVENGYDLIRRVRALPRDRGGAVPAMALTAYARTEDRMRAISAGFDSHLAKPVEPVQLAVTVSALARAARVAST